MGKHKHDKSKGRQAEKAAVAQAAAAHDAKLLAMVETVWEHRDE